MPLPDTFIEVDTKKMFSGGHFNPAVTLAVALVGKFPMRHLVPYWIAQIAGGFAGALLIRVGLAAILRTCGFLRVPRSTRNTSGSWAVPR